MKQKLLLTIALLCAVAQGAWAQRVVDLSTISSDYVAHDGDVLTGKLDVDHNPVKISIAKGAKITLRDVTILGIDESVYTSVGNYIPCPFAGITCEGDATITLEGTNQVKGFCRGWPGICVYEGYTLTIQGDGSLDVSCNQIGAGIGGEERMPCGDINIKSGTITAMGEYTGAGIGGCEANGGTITIEGGTIEAKGGTYAAGIGGGRHGTGGNIFIYGGDIKAYGGEYGAGIGGGTGGRGGAIWITGGTVKAYGGTDAAGIGGGEDGDSGSIVINGGDVYASGDGYGVGIGAGEDGDVDNTISINGGTVDAYGGLDIRRAIGGEDPEDYSNISIGDRMSITNVSGEELLPYHLRGYFLSSYIRLKFEPCDHAGATYSIVNAEKHKCTCLWCGYNAEEDHNIDDNNPCVCGYGTETHKVHLYAVDSNHQYQEVSTLEVAEGKDFTLPLSVDTPSDYLFRCWLESTPDANDNGIMGNWGAPIEPGTTMTMGVNDRNFMARYEAKNVNLGWIEENKVLKDGMVVSGKLEKNCMISIADGATVTLRDATILGIDDVDYMWGGINCQGDATIILEGENVVRGFYSFAPGIYVPQGKTLTIQGDGSLDASSNGYGAGIGGGSEYACGNIVINGGAIKATGGYQSAGIGAGLKSSCGDITISLKVISVTAIKGKDAPHSIGANDGITGTITIGKVKTGPISESPYTYYPSLDVSGDMTADLEEVMGKTLDVTFRGRKFIKDSEWNTLCLPFSMTAEQISNSPLNNSKIVELDTEKTTLSDGVLTIAYKTATAIEAGKPYMVKWVIDEETGDTHIDDPIFKNVTISTAEPTAVSAAGISFCGAFAPLALANGDKTKLWLDDDVRLRWASGQDEQVSPTWCYWNLGGLDASTLNAIVVTFDDGSMPIVELMDGMTDFSILSKFGEQEVNASLEGRELSAVLQADGTWQSRAYTLCLPFYAELFGTGSDFTIYSKAEVTQDGELLFTQEMLPFLYPGNAYLIVVNKGTLRLQEEGVTIIDEAREADDDTNAVPFNYVDEQTAGYWLGSLKTIGHDEAVSRKAFTLANDGSFKIINHARSTWKWPAFRAMFCATDLMTADKLTTKYQLDANGEEEEDRSLPAPDSYQGDNDGEATGIAPVIHTIDCDGTERWFDLNGRQLSGKPTKKGVYIHRGKKQVVK